ncbi:MAG: META domain-containing protein [Bacteroidetes bacterium]|nr:META domain-containing protein [Bacteroidota bacterium]
MKLANLFLNSTKKYFKFTLVLSLVFTAFLTFSQKPNIKNGVSYNLEAVFIGGQKNVLVKDKATLIFDTKNQTANCSNKCSFIDLKYCLKRNKFKFSSVIPAAAACPDHLVGIESDLKENLPKANRCKSIDKRLIFFNKKDTLLIFYEQ